jgi:hypothetical protein
VGNLREARLSIAFKPGGNAFTPSFFMLERSDLEREAWSPNPHPRRGGRGEADGHATAARPRRWPAARPA